MTAKEPGLDVRFWNDQGVDYCEITVKGMTKETFITKVRPSDVARFAEEYAAYKSGAPEPDPGGVPLTDVIGMTTQRAFTLRQHKIRNAEELAALSDIACQNLGMGMLTLRDAAKQLLASAGKDRELDEMKKRLIALEGKRGPGRPRKEETAGAVD